nr:RiPP maturation radical SAM C-methyltransferase [uncultured Rhodoferax sp.]
MTRIMTPASLQVLDLCLVVPPFESLHHPSLGVAVLKSACQFSGIETRILHGGLLLAALTGVDRYDAVYDSPMRHRLGERLFRPFAYDHETTARLASLPPLDEGKQRIVTQAETSVEPALKAIVKSVLDHRPKIVGLTSSFQQNLAASAIARLIKQIAPEIVIVMGGPNVAGSLGEGLARAFPWINYFFTGEADVDFPAFCRTYLDHGKLPESRIVPSIKVGNMRNVYPPDYSDYFAMLRPLQVQGVLPASLPRYLMAETSRGCWWGVKHHCTFCGLNADNMAFEAKDARRVLDELEMLKEWNVPLVMMTDNIMPIGYLKDLFPALSEQPDRLGMFYEVKANLSEGQVDQLVEGGVVAVQPGIESLSTSVLRLMRKGISAHKNIALLRSCSGVGLQVFWNILYGFPGEQASDYQEVVALLPRLHHLYPPSSLTAIVIDRFSPLFVDSVASGVAPIAPQQGYTGLYPPEIPAADVAFHFTGDYLTGLTERPELLQQLESAVSNWKEAWTARRPPILQAFEHGDGAMVFDTRKIARQQAVYLGSEQFAALRSFENPRNLEAIDADLAKHANWLMDRDFVISHEGKLMSIVVRPRSKVAMRRVGSNPGAASELGATIRNIIGV